jgi:CheY-like chemotaxis protein
MPEIDGFEFLKMLRENVEIKQPKFLFITGGVDTDEATQKIIERNSNGFLSKPFKNEQIKNKISSMFEELKNK